MAKWPVHRKTHRTIQKHVEHQDIQEKTTCLAVWLYKWLLLARENATIW